jgi:hypothetical protein
LEAVLKARGKEVTYPLVNAYHVTYGFEVTWYELRPQSTPGETHPYADYERDEIRSKTTRGTYRAAESVREGRDQT